MNFSVLSDLMEDLKLCFADGVALEEKEQKLLSDFINTKNSIAKKDLEIESLCSPKNLKEKGLVLIKEKSFLGILIKSLESLKESLSLTAIFSPKLWSQTLESEQIQQLLHKHLSVGFLSSSMDECIHRMSHYFYKKKVQPYLSFVDGRILGSASVDPSALVAQNVFVGKDCIIRENVRIMPGSVLLGNVEIGPGTIIHPNVTLYPGTKIGKNVILHSGVVIGGDGFGFNFSSGKHLKVYHFGGALIEDDVEIGANSCVDGGTIDATRVGQGSKIDNHVQIGHNCSIGRHVVLCGHVAIGGSTELGDYCVMGGKSGTGSGLTIGAGSQIAGGGLVNCNWPEKSVIGGHPARNLKEWMRGLAYLRKNSLRPNAS